MANVKISQLPAAASASGTQEFEVNDSLTSKKVTGTQIKTFVNADRVEKLLTLGRLRFLSALRHNVMAHLRRATSALTLMSLSLKGTTVPLGVLSVVVQLVVVRMKSLLRTVRL